jgi:TctA family transporter
MKQKQIYRFFLSIAQITLLLLLLVLFDLVNIPKVSSNILLVSLFIVCVSGIYAIQRKTDTKKHFC